MEEQGFKFYTSTGLVALTGKKASNLKELLLGIKEIPESSLFYHTHHFLKEHLFMGGAYTNDFAYWTASHMREKELAEKIANIDICEYLNLEDLRGAFVKEIESYLSSSEDLLDVPAGEEFHFSNAVTLVIPTDRVVTNLEEFKEALNEIGEDSLYFHFFEARLRLEHGNNDFSYWIDTSLNKPELAAKVGALDPYMYTLAELKDKIMALVLEEIENGS